MGYDNSLVAEMKKVVGFKNFYDLAEIPDLGAGLTSTESDQYYQQFNPAVRLNYILPTIDQGRTLVEYLDTTETQAIGQVLDAIETKKQIGNFGKDLASSDVVFGVGRKVTTLVNQGYFSGVMFEVRDSIGIRATINRIGLYLTAAVTDLDLYLFHSSKEAVVSQFTFTSALANSFAWQVQQVILDFDDGVNTGGTWYLGYYQSDLQLQSSASVQFNSMNWLHGYGTCCSNDPTWNPSYQSIYSRVKMSGFYVQGPNLPVSKTERFEPSTVIKTNNNNHGFNFNISVTCNLTQFWKENRLMLKKVIGYQVAMNLLLDMKTSMQINNVEEALKVMIMRDLEGPIDTMNKPLHQKLDDAIDALTLDEGNLNTDCLPCARKPKTTYGALG
jgi:hypothetical protein